jgi:hypothetical protein
MTRRARCVACARSALLAARDPAAILDKQGRLAGQAVDPPRQGAPAAALRGERIHEIVEDPDPVPLQRGAVERQLS